MNCEVPNALFQSAQGGPQNGGALPQTEGLFVLRQQYAFSGTKLNRGSWWTIPQGYIFLLYGVNVLMNAPAMADVPAAMVLASPSTQEPTGFLDFINFIALTSPGFSVFTQVSSGGNSGQSMNGMSAAAKAVIPGNWSIAPLFLSATGTAFNGTVQIAGLLIKDENFRSQKGAFTL